MNRRKGIYFYDSFEQVTVYLEISVATYSTSVVLYNSIYLYLIEYFFDVQHHPTSVT